MCTREITDKYVKIFDIKVEIISSLCFVLVVYKITSNLCTPLKQTISVSFLSTHLSDFEKKNYNYSPIKFKNFEYLLENITINVIIFKHLIEMFFEG